MKDVAPGWSSHMFPLSKILLATKGPVLEMGVGIFSTPIMHWICQDSERELVSYESDPEYYNLVKQFENKTHKIYFVRDWSKIEIERPWDVAFIDHKPEERRRVDIKRLAKWVKYLVVHDTNPDWNSAYRYDKIFPLFKYRLDYTKAMPNTTILSNFKKIIL